MNNLIKQIFCRHYWREYYWKEQLRFMGHNYGYATRFVCTNCGKITPSYEGPFNHGWRDKTGNIKIDQRECYGDMK